MFQTEKMRIKGYLSFCIFLIALGEAAADHKRWLPNTNFENPSNWENGNLPCENDHLKFPESLGAVYIQTNTTISEMVLPLYGELILGDYVSISFPVYPTYKPGCPLKREIQYVRTQAKTWVDPENWCMTAEEGGDCTAEQPQQLASERIPCQSDTAMFPQRATFLVSLGYGVDIKTGSLIISGNSYTSTSFKGLIESEEGGKQFVRDAGSPSTTVTVTGNQCRDESGCACGNDRGTILEKICEAWSVKCDSTLPCTHPLRPMGECCDMCGALMKLDITSSFKKTDLENLILKRYVHGDVKYKDIKFVVSKTSLGQIQVVLNDGGNGELVAEVALDLENELKTKDYGVTDIKVEISQNVKPTPSGQTDQPVNGGTIAAIILSIFVVAAIIAVIAYFLIVKKKRPSLPSPIDVNFTLEKMRTTFTSFGKSNGASDMELGSVSYKNAVPMDDVLNGFDNPMYGDVGPATDMSDVHISFSGKPVQPATPEPKSVTLEAVSDSSEGFSNPVYGVTPIDIDFQPLGEAPAKSKSSKSSKKSSEKLTFPDATNAGFSNPLYAKEGKESKKETSSSAKPNIRHTEDGSVLVLNPVFSTLGESEDSML